MSISTLEERVLERFRSIYKCGCFLCQEKQHPFTTTAADMESFILTVIKEVRGEEAKKVETFFKERLAEYLADLEQELTPSIPNRIRSVFGLYPPNYTKSPDFISPTN